MADRRRRRLQAHRRAAARAPAPQEGQLPTPERLRRGEIEAQPLVTVRLSPAERDWTGERPSPLRKTAAEDVHRDLAAGVRRRLARFRRLSDGQIAAAERFERDWDLARLEPSMVCDTSRPRGPRGWMVQAEASAAVLDARDRVQAARAALRTAGPDVVQVVEGVVILEATAGGLGAQAYAARRDAAIYVHTMLGVGLNLLASHYAGRRRTGGVRRTPGEAPAGGPPPGRRPAPPADTA